MTSPSNPLANEPSVTQMKEFLRLAYCGLVLRGYNNERSIPDAILRRVWRYGKKLQLAERNK